MSFTLGPGIDELPADWAFDLGLSFLTAAQSCGFTCERAFVSDGTWVEPCCDPCQLVVQVDAGWTADPRAGKGSCLPILTVTVKLLLDQCTIVPDSESTLDPVAESTKAQESITERWAIMEGLRVGRAAGLFTVACGKVAPSPWTLLWTSGACARWQTVWSLTI